MDSEVHTANTVGTLGQLWELSLLLADDADAGLAERGLTRARGDLLMRVLLAGEPPTLRELADALKVTPRNVTGLVDALSAQDYLRRRPHPADRRATLVELTDQGRAAVQEMFDGANRMAEELLGGLPPAELAAFAATLTTVIGNARAALGVGP